MKELTKFHEKVKKVSNVYKSKKPIFIKTDSVSGDESEAVLEQPTTSATDIESVEEPTLIRISKKVGEYGGAFLGGILGSKIGINSGFEKMGGHYGKKIASYGAKRLIEKVPILGSFKKGGHVKKTGVYLLHKGETVIPYRKKRK